MTNIHSFAGGFVWAAVAAILMLATFEPVSTKQAPALQVASAPAANTAA